MKKLLAVFIVLGLCCATKATVVSLKDEGSTITATPGQAIVLELEADGLLSGFDAIASFTGDATITGAMSSADAANYGWDVINYQIDPIYGPDYVEIGGFLYVPHRRGTIGHVEITYGSGTVVVSLARGTSLPPPWPSWGPLDVSSGVVTIVPEPGSILLLGLGAVLPRRRR